MHETRKALKRVRALMRLLEGELGAKRARRERALLRDAAARLAGARDAEVMVSTLDALMERHPRKLGRRRGVMELREVLERERRDASARTLGDAATRERVAEELSDVRARVSQVEAAGTARRTSSRRRAWSTSTAPGAPVGAAPADASAGPARLHRWRKHVKDLRYAAEILDVREPPGAEPSGKRGTKRRSKHRKRRSKHPQAAGPSTRASAWPRSRAAPTAWAKCWARSTT